MDADLRSWLFRLEIPLSQIPRQFPDGALTSELAVELRIEALTALLTESCLMFLTDGDRFSIRVVLTSQCPSPYFYRNRGKDTQLTNKSKTFHGSLWI